jgi:hypothetical protein
MDRERTVKSITFKSRDIIEEKNEHIITILHQNIFKSPPEDNGIRSLVEH